MLGVSGPLQEYAAGVGQEGSKSNEAEFMQ